MNRALDWVGSQGQPLILTMASLLVLGFFLAAVWAKFRVLKVARPEVRLDNLGLRFIHMLKVAIMQSKLFKRSGAGWMHALIFWGFFVLLLRATQFFIIGFFPEWQPDLTKWESVWSAYLFIKDIFIALVICAVTYALYRRLVVRPNRLTLSSEGLVILGLILMIMVSDMVFEGAYFSRQPVEASWRSPFGYFLATAVFSGMNHSALIIFHNLAYWGHVFAILGFIVILPNSKHFHIITSFPNTFFAKLGSGSALKRLDFEDENREAYGVTRIDQFSWKQLLDFHTCTECGRCDLVCPALNSNKPLSPKMFTVNLRNHLKEETQTLLNREMVTVRENNSLMGGAVISDETVWSCTTCGACEEECPVEIEYVEKMIDLRRALILDEDRYPQEFSGAFKSLETNSNPWGFGRDSRADWAQDFDIKIWDKENPTEYLYFVGCNGSFDNRGKKISASVVDALNRAGVNFSILGRDEGCTGDPARRAGNEYLFDMLASKNAEMFLEQGIIKVVTHCPHCFNTLKNEYPEFGAKLEVMHHSELLARLKSEGKLPSGEKPSEKVVVHDSCYMGRHNGEYDAPRRVLTNAIKPDQIKEVENSRERGSCCGAGGARFLLEENTGTRMSHNRIDELMEAEPDTIAVSCPFCVLMLEDGLKAKGLEKVQVKDISEII